MDITVTVRGESMTCDTAERIVSRNTGCILYFDLDDAWRARHDKKLTFAFVQEDGNAETTVELSGYSYLLPEIPDCLSVQLQLHADATNDSPAMRTTVLGILCEPGVRSLGSQAYTAPFDAYNACMDYINGKITGHYSDAELAEKLQEIRAHAAQAAVAFPSIGYRRAIAAYAPETRITGSLRWPEDDEEHETKHIADITDGTIAVNTLAVTTSALRDDFILPGGVPAAECALSFRRETLPSRDIKGAELSLTFEAMQENGQWYPVPLGVFTVASVGDDTAAGTPITAYDDMRKLDDYTHTYGFETGRAYSPQQIIETLAETAGIDYDGEVDFDERYINNGVGAGMYSVIMAAIGSATALAWREALTSVPVDATDEEAAAMLAAQYGEVLTYKGSVQYEEQLPDNPEMFDAYLVRYTGPRYVVSDMLLAAGTLRDTLMHTVTTIGAFACVDRSRKLRIVPIARPDSSSDDTQLPANKVTRQKISRSDYRLYRLTTMYDAMNSEGFNETIMRSVMTWWPDGVSAMLPTDALWPTVAGRNQSQKITNMIYRLVNVLDPVYFPPGQVELYGDPSIGLWDWLTISGARFPAASIVWKYRGLQTIYSGGADALAGQQHTQLDKTMYANKLAASTSSENTWRQLYKHLMQQYQGLNTFRYEELEHYKYAEWEEWKQE